MNDRARRIASLGIEQPCDRMVAWLSGCTATAIAGAAGGPLAMVVLGAVLGASLLLKVHPWA